MGQGSRTTRCGKIGRKALVAALLATTVVGGGVAASTVAQAQQAYTVPAGPLNRALATFGSQSGTQISYDATIVRGKSSQGVSAAATRQQAIDQLLRGTGLRYSFTDSTSVVVSAPSAGGGNIPADGSTVLETIVVQGKGAATEGTGSYTAEAVTVGKTAESIKETPQSVTVVTSKQIEDRNLATLTDALNTATGVTVVTDEYVNAGKFYSRGFMMNNVRVDGGAVSALGINDFISSPELVKYDRVEILRGADGLYSGAGEPGGVINLVRKRPLAERQIKASASAGSWQNYQSTLDMTGPLTQEGNVRGRIVGALGSNDYFYDISDAHNKLIYGALEADIGDNTTAMIGASFEHKNETPWYYGLPRYSDGTAIDFPRHTSLGTDWSHKKHESWEIFGDVNHTFDNGWKWATTATYMRQHYQDKYGYLSGAVDPATLDGMYYSGGYFESEGYQAQLDTNLSGSFDLFDRTHEFVIGADYSKHDSSAKRAYFYGPSVNLADLGTSYWPEPVTPAFGIGTDYTDFPTYGQERYGLYGRTRLEITDPLHVIVGARYSNYKQFLNRSGVMADGTISWTENNNFSDNGVFTPFAAVTYDLTPQWTAYASYAEIYLPQASYLSGPEPGKPLDPITGRAYETGLKGELLDGALNTSIALYYTQRKGEAVYDARYAGSSNPDDGSACCYLASGEVVSRGVDLEVSGEVLPGLQMYAGYTFNDNENKDADSRYSKVTPRHLFKLWGTYNFPGDLEKWTVGAGVRVQSRSGVSGQEWVDGVGLVPYDTNQGGYAVADASVSYKFNEKVTATLNVNNIFDREYFSGLGPNSKNNYYGEPRSFMFTMRASF